MMNDYEVKHIGMLRPYLAECMVLLKKNGKFPLDGPCRMAAYGSGVRYTVKGGTGSGEVNSRYFVTVEQGLKDAGFDVVSDEWAYQYAQYLDHAKKKFSEELKEKAKREKLSLVSASMGAVMRQPEYHIPMDHDCDAAIYVVSRISGEGSDRQTVKGDFLLTDSEVRDILKLNREYERFMLVINAGGPVDLSPVLETGNILVMSQLGVEAGAALADVLLGKTYPSGKLATTWAEYEAYCSEGDFGEKDDTRYKEGIYVGYRYFDTFDKKPLFPFGFGLGYTDFSIGRVSVSADGPMVEVGAKIKNTGKLAGKETLQVYVSCPSGRLDREAKSLAGFAKTDELKPGESRPVTVCFDIRDLAAFDQDSASYVLEAGDYIVLTGADSSAVKPAAVLRLKEDFTVRKTERLFGGADFDDLRSSGERRYKASRTTKVIKLDLAGSELPDACVAVREKTANNDLHGSDEQDPGNASDVNVVSEKIQGSDVAGCGISDIQNDSKSNGETRLCEMDFSRAAAQKNAKAFTEGTLLANMSDSDLAYLNIGAFDPKKPLANVIGDSAMSVAGAAGESNIMFKDAGIDSIIMADGPAGVRIAREYYEDKKGKHSVGVSMPDGMLENMPKAAKKLMEKIFAPGKHAEIHEQYCTAIPVGTAIAQSWNLDFAELCGDIVGSEMDIFGIDFWLAPALNIHRNVLCGRNFEYFSEDPLISGSFAAALSRGVQKHPGRGVTIKHFAANNQETNRYASNSVISERALREIYLKGFGICVKEADPMAVMTSYNLINGEHTSESKALTKVLREEFGFGGLVMTDWLIGGDLLLAKDSKYGIPDPAKVAAAGCSLFMPGRKDDYRRMMKGLKEGRVTAAQLRENAGWLLHTLERVGKLLSS